MRPCRLQDRLEGRRGRVGLDAREQAGALLRIHEGHEPAANDIKITSGNPDRDAYAFELLPTLLVNCRRDGNHLVVVGHFRPPSATADPELAARIKEYAELGIETFIFSGYPHLEEAYRLAELVFPLLPLELARAPGQANLTGPFGEVIANDIVPQAVRSAS